MTDFVLSLGSNVGDGLATLQAAVTELAETPEVTLTDVSSVYRTEPWGGVDQDDFLNLVVLGDTDLTPAELHEFTQAVEQRHGRTRAVRWGPRTLDIDILTFGDAVFDDPTLTLPHPRAHERAFVLVPWLEVAPHAVIPDRGSVSELLDAVGAVGVVRLADVRVALPRRAIDDRP